MMLYHTFSKLRGYHELSVVMAKYVIFMTAFYLNSKVFYCISTIILF